MVSAGFSAVSASCMVNAMSRPRSVRQPAGDNARRSMRCHVKVSASTRTGGGSRPSVARNVTVLPEPDSPTTPRHSPRCTSRSTPSTARTAPRSPWNVTRRPPMRRIGSPIIGVPIIASASVDAPIIVFQSSVRSPSVRASSMRRLSMRRSSMRWESMHRSSVRHSSVQPRIECLARALAGQVDRQHDDQDRQAGQRRHPPPLGEELTPVRHHPAP